MSGKIRCACIWVIVVACCLSQRAGLCSCYNKKAQQWPNESRWNDNRHTKELVIMAESDYHACIHENRGSCVIAANDFESVLTQAGGWSVAHDIRDSDLDVGDIKDSAHGGSDHADCGDLFLFVGHGPHDPLDYDPLHQVEGYFHIHHDDSTNEDDAAHNVAHGEVTWGDGDMEWCVAFTCNYLLHAEDSTHPIVRDRIRAMFQNGLHAIAGYCTKININAPQMDAFARNLLGTRASKGGFCGIGKHDEIPPQSIRNAWFAASNRYQAEQGNKGQAYTASYLCVAGYENEYIPGNIWELKDKHTYRAKPDPVLPVGQFYYRTSSVLGKG